MHLIHMPLCLNMLYYANMHFFSFMRDATATPSCLVFDQMSPEPGGAGRVPKSRNEIVASCCHTRCQSLPLTTISAVKATLRTKHHYERPEQELFLHFATVSSSLL